MSDDVPFDADDQLDDFVLGEGVADGKTVQTIIEESTFPPVPRGRNDFIVKAIKSSHKDEHTGAPCQKVFEVFMQNEETGLFTEPAQYEAYELEVTLALAENPKVTVRDFFRLPPLDEEQNDIYMHSSSAKAGTEVANRKSINGFWYNKVRRFVHALGHGDGEDGRLAESARVLGNWRSWPDGSPRTISVDIEDQKDYQNNNQPKLSKSGTVMAGVKLMSYQPTEETLGRLNPRDGLRNGGSAPPTPQPVQPNPPVKPQAKIGQSATQAPVRPAPAKQTVTAPVKQAAPVAAPATKPARRF